MGAGVNCSTLRLAERMTGVGTRRPAMTSTMKTERRDQVNLQRCTVDKLAGALSGSKRLLLAIRGGLMQVRCAGRSATRRSVSYAAVGSACYILKSMSELL